jgi:glycosidase
VRRLSLALALLWSWAGGARAGSQRQVPRAPEPLSVALPRPALPGLPAPAPPAGQLAAPAPGQAAAAAAPPALAATAAAPPVSAAAPPAPAAAPSVPAEPPRLGAALRGHAPWPEALRRVTTPAEVERVRALAHGIVEHPAQAQELLDAFYGEALAAIASQPQEVRRRHRDIPADWHKDPLYYVYPDAVTAGRGRPGTLFDTARLLAHAKRLGAGGVYLLPPFDSPGGDAGFDVRSFRPAERLGGEAGFDALMRASRKTGLPVIVDLPFNHVSAEHEWVKRLAAGETELASRFVQVPADWVKVGERELGGRTFAIYRDAAGTETPRWIVFPHAARDHVVELDSGGRPVRLYHTFYPFQLDLNLRNPEVFRACARVAAGLINRGVMGFRLDALLHWLKRDGTASEGLPETKLYAELLNRFVKLVGPRTRVFPEIGAGTPKSAGFVGPRVALKRAGRVPAMSDGFWGFELRAAIPESVATGDASPFWRALDRLPARLAPEATVLAMVTHHDEIGGFFQDPERTIPLLLKRGAVPFRDGSGVSGRLAPMVGFDPRRQALAEWLMFMFPHATPTNYYGEEAGLGNDLEHARRRQQDRLQVLRAMGMAVADESQAYDSRDIQRQPVELHALEAAENALPFRVFRRLAALRKARPELRSARKPLRLTPRRGPAAAMLLGSPGSPASVLSAANLGERPLTLRLPLWRLRAALGLPPGARVDARRLYGTAPRGRRAFRVEGETLVLRLPPAAFLLLDLSGRAA